MVVAFVLCYKCLMVVAFVLRYKCWLVVAFVLCWMVVAFVLQLGFGGGVSGHGQCPSSTSREMESHLHCLCLQKHTQTVLASDLAFSVLCMPQFPRCAWISNKTPVPILFHHNTLPRFMGGATSGCVAYKDAARVEEGGYCWVICMQTLAVFHHTNSQPYTLAYDW